MPKVNQWTKDEIRTLIEACRGGKTYAEIMTLIPRSLVGIRAMIKTIRKNGVEIEFPKNPKVGRPNNVKSILAELGEIQA